MEILNQCQIQSKHHMLPFCQLAKLVPLQSFETSHPWNSELTLCSIVKCSLPGQITAGNPDLYREMQRIMKRPLHLPIASAFKIGWHWHLIYSK